MQEGGPTESELKWVEEDISRGLGSDGDKKYTIQRKIHQMSNMREPGFSLGHKENKHREREKTRMSRMMLE